MSGPGEGGDVTTDDDVVEADVENHFEDPFRGESLAMDGSRRLGQATSVMGEQVVVKNHREERQIYADEDDPFLSTTTWTVLPSSWMEMEDGYLISEEVVVAPSGATMRSSSSVSISKSSHIISPNDLSSECDENININCTLTRNRPGIEREEYVLPPLHPTRNIDSLRNEKGNDDDLTAAIEQDIFEKVANLEKELALKDEDRLTSTIICGNISQREDEEGKKEKDEAQVESGGLVSVDVVRSFSPQNGVVLTSDAPTCTDDSISLVQIDPCERVELKNPKQGSESVGSEIYHLSSSEVALAEVKQEFDEGSASSCNLFQLPVELLCEIITHIRPCDLYFFAATCRRLYKLCQSCHRQLRTSWAALTLSISRVKQGWEEWELLQKYKDTTLLQEACRRGSLSVCRYLRSNGCVLGDAAVAAAGAGHVEVLAWAVQCGAHTEGLVNAATSHLPALQYAIEVLNLPLPQSYITTLVALSGRIDVLQYLTSKGVPTDPSAVNAAARGGRLRCLRWLVAKGCQIDLLTSASAARGGHLHVLEYLFECEDVPCPPSHSLVPLDSHKVLDWRVAAEAAKGGHIHVLEWLAERGCPLNEQGLSMENAARSGYLETLAWLMERGCRADERTMVACASTGSIKGVQWLLERGCPWGSSAVHAAMRNGHIDCAKWMKKHGMM